MIMKDMDLEILKSLYKFPFLREKQIAMIVGENEKYIKSRMKKMVSAGMVQRKTIEKFAVNFITKEGIKAAGLEARSVRVPKINNSYEHNMGLADVCIWLSGWRCNQDGREYQFINLGSIVTERDFRTVKEMIKVGNRKDGQPVYLAADRDIHAPDAYFKRHDGTYAAIEFERTRKSSVAVLRKNVVENMKRFSHQYWVYDDPYIAKMLKKIQDEVGKSHMSIYDIRVIRRNLESYLHVIPDTISEKSGIPRKAILGKMAIPIALNRLPVIAGYNQEIRLENRNDSSDKSIVTSDDRPVDMTKPVTEQALNTTSHAKLLFERR